MIFYLILKRCKESNKKRMFSGLPNCSIATTVRQMVLKVMVQSHAKGEAEKANALSNAFDLDGAFVSDQSFSPWETVQ